MIAQDVIDMIEKLEGCRRDAEKFDSGNKAAGTRVRMVMQEIKVDAQAVRTTISGIKNAE